MTARRHTVSAVLTNYNHGRYLRGAIDTILRQTVPFDEIIVIDDASTDDSVEIITSLIGHLPQARLILNPVNRGVIYGLNLGLGEATGDFIFYLSADDTYDTRILEWSRALLERYPDLAMISGNIIIHQETTGRERQFILPFAQAYACHPKEALIVAARRRCVTFLGGGNLIRRDVTREAGGYIAELKWHADWFLYLIVAFRHGFGLVPETFARIRMAGDQYSHACFVWKTQRPVIEAFIRILRRDYPQEYPIFRRCALLPTYDMQALVLLLKDKELRQYLTPLLGWRLISYKLLRVFGRCIPPELRDMIRRKLRV